VTDVRGWLAAAQVAVAPLSLARGVQNKVLEAMAMARPVVASPEAFEGIDAEPGRDLLVASSDEAFAAAVLRLLIDPAEAREIGTAARARMVARYAWERQLARFGAVLLGGEGVPARTPA
jgi:polysaccharide biosynthesis protein PslH